MITKSAALLAAASWMVSAVTSQASTAADFVNGRHWMCRGSRYNSDLANATLPYKVILGANTADDQTFSDTAFMEYNLDGVKYIGAYSTKSYLFDNESDGAGLYFSEVVNIPSQSDNLYKTVLRWIDRFVIKIHAVGNPAGDQYPYHLEGQIVTGAGTVTDLACDVMPWPPK